MPTTLAPPTDRSHDVSQPLDKLGPDETIKWNSDYLRGTIEVGLLDRITGALPADDTRLMKAHGMYQQDDRDVRDERRRQKLEPDYRFMIRVRLPGGHCTPQQWLKLDELARQHGNDQIRITTRQTFQFHWVVKGEVRPAIQGLHEALLDSIAACGDVNRNVMQPSDADDSKVQAEVTAISARISGEFIPKSRAYHEIWYNDQRVAQSEPVEPFYGRTYLPRKFKIGFAVPPSNDIDIYTQDLGFIALAGPDGLEGFNVTIGGGMGRTENDDTTYPRLADVIGYIPKAEVSAATAITRASNILSMPRDSTGSRPRSSIASATPSNRRGRLSSPRTATASAGARPTPAHSIAPCSCRAAASGTGGRRNGSTGCAKWPRSTRAISATRPTRTSSSLTCPPRKKRASRRSSPSTAWAKATPAARSG
jgi:sulfite reductase (NADPH) hemoprotein beta-component